MSTIYLMQHGAAVAKNVDPDRPLTDDGRRDVERLCRVIRERSLNADRVLHSGKARAQQSAELVASAFGAPVCLAVDGLSPKDPVAPWSQRLASATEDTVLVGHLPFMAQLATLLLAGREEPPAVAFRPGSMICLAADEGTWAVAWMMRPELLGD